MLLFQPAFKTIGHLLIILSGVMVAPAAVDYMDGNPEWETFLLSAGLTLFAGGLGVTVSGGALGAITRQQAFVLTTLSWVAVCVFGALPFLLGPHEMGATDALFESVSGLTTTGSTVMVGLDAKPAGILLWRSLLQGIGGIGIIVMGISILPFLRLGGMQIFRTESSDSSEKIVPRTQELAFAITKLYCVLMAACAAGYWAVGMSGFDAVNHALATVSTGGYSTSDQSFGKFSWASAQWICVLFMILGALPFAVYLRPFNNKRPQLFSDPQVRLMIGGLAVIWVIMALWQVVQFDTPMFEALTYAAFNTTSVVTTTGFASIDYMVWGPPAMAGFYLLTFVGGCSGSTSGGLKMYRLVIMAKVWRHIGTRMVHPHALSPVIYMGTPVSTGVIASVLSFCLVYVGTILAIALILAGVGLDFASALSGAATSVANVGPGVGPVIGPAGTFASIPDAGKWALTAGMLLGRLELLTVFVIFSAGFWRH